MDAEDWLDRAIQSISGGLAQLRHLRTMKGEVPEAHRAQLEHETQKVVEILDSLSKMNFRSPR